MHNVDKGPAVDASDIYPEKIPHTVCAASAFVLTIYCRNNPAVQAQCYEKAVEYPNGTLSLIDCYFEHLRDQESDTPEKAHFSIWIILSLSQLWSTIPEIKWYAITHDSPTLLAYESPEHSSAEGANHSSFNTAQDMLAAMSLHRNPHVRAAAIYAIRTLLSGIDALDHDPNIRDHVSKVRLLLYSCLICAANDGSPTVRKELAYTIGGVIFGQHTMEFIGAIAHLIDNELDGPQRVYALSRAGVPADATPMRPEKSLYNIILSLTRVLLILSSDPHPDVCRESQRIVDTIFQAYLHSSHFLLQGQSLSTIFNQNGHFHAKNQDQEVSQVMAYLKNVSLDSAVRHPEQYDRNSGGDERPRRNSSDLLQSLRHSSSNTDLGSGRAHPAKTQLHRSNTVSLDPKRTSSPLPAVWEGSSTSWDELSRVWLHSTPSETDLAYNSPIDFHSATNLALSSSAEALDERVQEKISTKRELLEKAWQEWAKNELEGHLCESSLIDWFGAHYAEIEINVSNPPPRDSFYLIRWPFWHV